MRLMLTFLISLLPTIAAADALTDLRGALGRLGATAPLRGTLDVTSTSKSSEDERNEEGKASVGFEIGEGGLHIIYPRAMLVQATEEARAEARDPERATPVRHGASHVRPLHVADLLDGAAALGILLESAQFIQTKPATLGGRPVRVHVFKLNPKLSKSDSKHVKKLEGSLSVWVGDDGVPLAAEQSTSMKASFLLMSFENVEKESWTYARNGDRLFVTRYEANSKGDGFGQHSTSHTLEVVRAE